MKKLLLAGIFLFAGYAYAETFHTDTGRVQISTVPASPTQIYTAASWGNKAGESYILNDSGFNLVLSTSSTGISTDTTSGHFFLPNGTTPFAFDFDGALYAVISGTDQPKAVGILRKK